MANDVSLGELSKVVQSEVRALSANIMVHKGGPEQFKVVLPVIDEQFRCWKRDHGYEFSYSAQLVLQDLRDHHADASVISEFTRVYLHD